MNTPKTKNGANGISLFIEYLLERNINKSPTIAPDQNENTTLEKILLIPINQPSPTASFASPRPIHFPLETNHNNANGAEITSPDINSQTEGMCGLKP